MRKEICLTLKEKEKDERQTNKNTTMLQKRSIQHRWLPIGQFEVQLPRLIKWCDINPAYESSITIPSSNIRLINTMRIKTTSKQFPFTGQGNIYLGRHEEKKEEIWLYPVTKAPIPTEKSKKQRDNRTNATKNLHYTTIADRLRTVSWVIAVTQLVWLNRFTCAKPSH